MQVRSGTQVAVARRLPFEQSLFRPVKSRQSSDDSIEANKRFERQKDESQQTLNERSS